MEIEEKIELAVDEICEMGLDRHYFNLDELYQIQDKIETLQKEIEELKKNNKIKVVFNSDGTINIGDKNKFIRFDEYQQLKERVKELQNAIKKISYKDDFGRFNSYRENVPYHNIIPNIEELLTN